MRLLFALMLTPLLAIAQPGSYTIATIAGSNWVGDNGPATSALLFQAEGIAVDLAGNIYISDAANSRVRKVSPSGLSPLTRAPARQDFQATAAQPRLRN